MTSVICWALGWKDHSKGNKDDKADQDDDNGVEDGKDEDLEDEADRRKHVAEVETEMKEVEQHFKRLERRYREFKQQGERIAEEAEEWNFKAKVAVALGAGACAFGGVVAVAAATAGQRVLGLTGSMLGGGAVAVACMTMERCSVIFDEVEELLQNVEDGFLKVQDTYDVAWLKMFYDHLEQPGIPNLVEK